MVTIFENWSWSFLGIIIESLPFILIGSVISAFIQNFVSDEFIKNNFPKNKLVGIFCAAFIGILFPLCECAIVPISRSLIKRGLPIGVGITFMLAVPIVNPVVIMSTYYAFPNNMNITIFRTIGGVIAAIIVGLIIDKITVNQNIMKVETTRNNIPCDCCEIDYGRDKSKFSKFLNHSSTEFLNISKYFVLGAFLSSVFGVFYNYYNVDSIVFNKYAGILFMMLLGFLLSLCSEADAFVAKGFLQSFGNEAVLAFLILGPMMDLKNLFLSWGVFKKSFVIKLFIIITLVVLITCVLIGYFV